MNVEQLAEYCLSKVGTDDGFPFGPETMVFKVGGKIFAICGLERPPLFVNLKCDPEYALQLRADYEGIIIPGYHMNKQHWNSVYLESDMEMDLYRKLIDLSYDLIRSSLPKKKRAELDELEKNA
jgi:predicted DNA-binding protein (MmcQ/YjbR family)